MVFPQGVTLPTFTFFKAEWCWIQSLFYCQVSFSVRALWLQNSFIIYNAIRWGTKNSRRIKPTIFPVFKVNALMASFSLLTPHWTALTLDKSYSPRRRFTSEGVTLLALRTEQKLLAVSRPLLAKCQAGLSLWLTVNWLILATLCSSSFQRWIKQCSCPWLPLAWGN